MKWLLSVKVMIKEKCTVKKMIDNSGLLLMKAKVKSMYLQINMTRQMITARIKITKMLNLLTNALEQEMGQNKLFFGKYL